MQCNFLPRRLLSKRRLREASHAIELDLWLGRKQVRRLREWSGLRLGRLQLRREQLFGLLRQRRLHHTERVGVRCQWNGVHGLCGTTVLQLAGQMRV